MLSTLIPISLIVIALGVTLSFVLRCSPSSYPSGWDAEFKYGQEAEIEQYINKHKRAHNENENFVYQSAQNNPSSYDESIYNATVDYITNLDNFNVIDLLCYSLLPSNLEVLDSPGNEIKAKFTRDGKKWKFMSNFERSWVLKSTS